MTKVRRVLLLAAMFALVVSASAVVRSYAQRPVLNAGMSWDDGTGGCEQGNNSCFGHITK
jgi:hypothetical protein